MPIGRLHIIFPDIFLKTTSQIVPQKTRVPSLPTHPESLRLHTQLRFPSKFILHPFKRVTSTFPVIIRFSFFCHRIKKDNLSNKADRSKKKNGNTQQSISSGWLRFKNISLISASSVATTHSEPGPDEDHDDDDDDKIDGSAAGCLPACRLLWVLALKWWNLIYLPAQPERDTRTKARRWLAGNKRIQFQTSSLAFVRLLLVDTLSSIIIVALWRGSSKLLLGHRLHVRTDDDGFWAAVTQWLGPELAWWI